MSVKEGYKEGGYNPMKIALTSAQLNALNQTQLSIFKRGVSRLIQNHGAEYVTPEMIIGQYKLVTEYHLPNSTIELLNMSDDELEELAQRDNQ